MVHGMFLHPDLGIGGAERLVVDAGLALQERGHRVSYVTNHHDPNHCFMEMRDGTFPVTVVGDWIPRSIFGYCKAACAYFRMLYLTIYFLAVIAPVDRPDVLICDQIPIGVPLIKLFRFRVIFYCHFPDLLLSEPGGYLKKLYRIPINFCEEITMSCADRILVNSGFTSTVFRQTFQRIKTTPIILYPSIHTKMFDTCARHLMPLAYPEIRANSFIFLSINRYERKKNLGLAIMSLQALETLLSDEEYDRVHLIIAGGYDSYNSENIEYYEELQDLAEEQKMVPKVTFLKSPSDNLKVSLLAKCDCVLYTPANEHFGIVPLEAMYSHKPVIAVNSGGPTETVDHCVTGFLSQPVPENMAFHMSKVFENEEMRLRFGVQGRRRFQEKFSYAAFSRHLNSIIFNVTNEAE